MQREGTQVQNTKVGMSIAWIFNLTTTKDFVDFHKFKIPNAPFGSPFLLKSSLAISLYKSKEILTLKISFAWIKAARGGEQNRVRIEREAPSRDG
jgi:hypothetical protein